jgi:hypothetical protein
MATPADKIKRLRLPFTDSEDKYASEPKVGAYSTSKGPLIEAIKAKRERQAARSAASDRPKTTVMGSSENVSTGTGRGTTTMGDKTFKQAFAEARKSGQEQFTWNGKKYTTEMAKSKKSEEMEMTTPDSDLMEAHDEATRFKKGGCVKMAKGGSASSRGDGCAQRGKTKGRVV